MATIPNPHDALFREIYSCSALESLSVNNIVEIARQALHEQGEISMTIAHQLKQKGRQEGLQEGRQEGIETSEVIGGILFAQRMLKLTLYDRTELEQKDLDELRHLLAKLESAVLEREPPERPIM